MDDIKDILSFPPAAKPIADDLDIRLVWDVPMAGDTESYRVGENCSVFVAVRITSFSSASQRLAISIGFSNVSDGG